MSLDRIGYVYTFGMDEAELLEALETTDTGVLALSSSGSAYAIPVGCYYEDGSLYVRLTDDGASRKLSYLEATLTIGASRPAVPRRLNVPPKADPPSLQPSEPPRR